MDPANTSLEHWSTFWDQGYITTFGDTKPHNYDGLIREFWEEKFLDLPRGSRVLDIAAGNGAIATIAAETSLKNGLDLFVAATDLADIHAELIGSDETKQARTHIEFHSRTPCERQPFEADTFDLVTSQFGFEYSDIEATLREVRRVLVPDGRFVAVSHHAESQLINTAQAEREIYRVALDDLDLVGSSRRYFEQLGELPDDQASIDAVHKKFRPLAEEANRRVHEFQTRCGDDERVKFIVGTLGYIARTARRTTQQERLDALDKAKSDLVRHRARLNDMVDAAMDQDQIDALKISAHEAGFESVHCLTLYADDKALAGWQIHLR